jgi:[acyl-carrier-protein] S-malonyltransferase
VAAGSITLEEAVVLVRRRGLFMQEAVPVGEGGMAAVIGMPGAEVAEVAHLAAEEVGGVCSAANFNSPEQTVIAGDGGSIAKAAELLKARGAKRVLPLPVSAPFHCALMAPVQARLAPVLKAVAWRPLAVPVVSNVEATPNADPARAVALLVEQVTAPVRWIECVQALAAAGVTQVVEVGPGKVLGGLVKRIAPALETFNVEDQASLEKTLAALGRG